MLVYLLRHGDALNSMPDHLRELSHYGRGQIFKIADQLQEKGLQLEAVFHSGLVRAQSSAEILGRELSYKGAIVRADGLRPDDDVALWGEKLKQCTKITLLVGHNPFMAQMIYHLAQERVHVATGQFYALDIKEGENAKVLWTLTG